MIDADVCAFLLRRVCDPGWYRYVWRESGQGPDLQDAALLLTSARILLVPFIRPKEERRRHRAAAAPTLCPSV
jgi:hypothetical protein